MSDESRKHECAQPVPQAIDPENDNNIVVLKELRDATANMPDNTQIVIALSPEEIQHIAENYTDVTWFRITINPADLDLYDCGCAHICFHLNTDAVMA